jgi:hypothetical protein
MIYTDAGGRGEEGFRRKRREKEGIEERRNY